MAGEVFISYRRSDEPKARLLFNLLAQRGVSAWYDANVRAGEDWRAATAKALEAAPIFVLLYSKAASESDEIAKELAAATYSKKRVIPVRLENIPPTGPFLYELASRNWIDTFQDTDAAFARLADHIAEIVRADIPSVAATQPNPSHHEQQPSAAKSRRGYPPWMLAAGGAALLIAAVLLVSLWPRNSPAPPLSQRVAFFGFTAPDADPIAMKLAAETTDATFSEFTRVGIDAATRADTIEKPAADRRARTIELDAAYALSGEIRLDSGTAHTVIRLEDPVTRTTLWSTTLETPADKPFYSPSMRGAFRAAEFIDCIVAVRARLSRETPDWFQPVVAYCRALGGATGTGPEDILAAARTLAAREPQSAYFQAAFALALTNASTGLLDEQSVTRHREAGAAIASARKLASQDPFVVAVDAFIQNALGASPLAVDKLLANAKAGDARSEGWLLHVRGRQLLANGRTAEGIARMREAIALRPTLISSNRYQAFGLASQGRLPPAEVLFEETFKRVHENTLFPWVQAALLEGAGDPDALIKASPVQRITLECAQPVVAATREKGAKISRDVLRGCPDYMRVFFAAAFGDVDDAFEFYSALSFPNSFDTRMRLFTPSARAMRQQPAFVKLTDELGLMEYWMETKQRPDVCKLPEESTYPVCVELEKGLGK